MTDRLKEQLCRKIVLRTANSTVCDVDSNGAEIEDGLLQDKDGI